jgi:thioredoxin reductase (NADPH)
VSRIDGHDGAFVVHTSRRGVERETHARAVVIRDGYWGSPNRLGVPGEDLPHVPHAFREGHFAFQQNALVIGGGNSAAEAALDLWRAGSRVTLVHFGPTFDKKIKPWVLPDFTNRVAEGSINAVWNSRVWRSGRRTYWYGRLTAWCPRCRGPRLPDDGLRAERAAVGAAGVSIDG